MKNISSKHIPENTNIAIALVEPRIPQNTGNIARLCQCVGAELYVIGSLGFRMSDKHLSRSGMDYLKGITINHLPDMDTLLKEKAGWTPYFLSTKVDNIYTETKFPDKTILVFGSETHGLPEDILTMTPENSLTIPMQPDARSLNLSNSVAIVLYEVIRQWGKKW